MAFVRDDPNRALLPIQFEPGQPVWVLGGPWEVCYITGAKFESDRGLTYQLEDPLGNAIKGDFDEYQLVDKSDVYLRGRNQLLELAQQLEAKGLSKVTRPAEGKNPLDLNDQSKETIPSSKPKLTATLWEDEGTLCFQVEAKGICVARREDNAYINGTKLLQVTGMTRGRRDAIFKNEKERQVIKIGPAHLKGVWIPFNKALKIANQEKIADLLYPLFVENISQLMNVNLERPVLTSNSQAPNSTEPQGNLLASDSPQDANIREALDRAVDFRDMSLLSQIPEDKLSTYSADEYFISAIQKNRERLVQYLLERIPRLGNAVSKTGQTALMVAALWGNQNMITILLKAGASIDDVDIQGRTALSYAAQLGIFFSVEELLAHGASLTKDKEGRDPLSYAAQNGHYGVVTHLSLRTRALTWNGDYNLRSPLSYAAQEGHLDVVKFILRSKGFNVSETFDKQGRNPLSYAAQNGHYEVVSLLLVNGFDLHQRDSSNRTPLSWALLHRHHKVIELLKANGAIWDDPGAFTDSGYASNTLNSVSLAHQGMSQDDAKTVYSFGSVAEPERINYQLSFASEILKDLRLTQVNEMALDDLLSVLPDILKRFAMKLGQNASQEKDYHAMFFVSKYRSEITNTLLDQWRSDKRTLDRLESNEMSSNERVQIWREAQARFQGEHEIEAGESKHTELDDVFQVLGDDVHDLDLSQDNPVDLGFITTAPAYSWLLSKLTSSVRLSVPKPNTMIDIRETIRKCLPNSQKLNRSTPRLLHTIMISMDWPIVWFLNAYDFGNDNDYARTLKTFVTLVSDGEHVQALTALEYLQQMWPQTGEAICNLVIKAVQSNHGQASASVADSIIQTRTANRSFLFKISGTADTIAEIGEVLSWMGAVFRPSPEEDVVYECIPSVSIPPQDSSSLINNPQNPPSRSCTIEYNLRAAKTGLSHCWHSIFKYAVVAMGFPILKRPDSAQGLEMSLGMMLGLSQAHHIGCFNETIVVKGFSSMFWLSEYRPGISMWHFTGSYNGPHISYPREGTNYRGLGVQEILQDRHFIGWCSNFIYGAGALDATHRVQSSCLPRVYSGCYLFERKVHRGRDYAAETVCIAYGPIGVPSLRAPQDLQRKLERIHAKPVVFWDTASQRGWLTNGTSALLHLILASIEKGDNPFTSTYDLRKSDIIQRKTNTEDAAAYVLLDERNLRLQIRSHLGQPVYLQDRVQDILYLLDLMMEQQTLAVEKNSSVNTNLEGWDYCDLINVAPDVLHPRVFLLDKDCSGWLQLLKDSYAVTLFGEGFGELFKPSISDRCNEWAILPPGRCYLAASVADLEKIAEFYGGRNRTIPRKLTANTTWPVVQRTFEQCACSTTSEHSDLVQVLLPDSAFTTTPDIKGIVRDVPRGAVIFGPTIESAWLRSNYFSTPTESRKRLRRDYDSDLNDSGLGDSISSAPTETSSPKFTDYLVAIICALPKELFAVRCLFDETYSDPSFDKYDKNSYAFGRIFSCKVVAACIPGIYGTNSAAHVVVELYRSFPNIEFCLLVGIAGGIPTSKNDIRLGDVVVSRPSSNNSGLIKYDFEKVMQDGASLLLGNFNHPPKVLLSAIGILESDPHSQEPLTSYIKQIGADYPIYRHPGADLDILYDSNHNQVCTNCTNHILERQPRISTHPRIHYGLIASGDKLIKDAKVRNQIGTKYDALCFEMEGAGIANALPSLVIRGISDYSDSSKNDVWQEYASATAAAFAKLILGKIRRQEDP